MGATFVYEKGKVGIGNLFLRKKRSMSLRLNLGKQSKQRKSIERASHREIEARGHLGAAVMRLSRSSAIPRADMVLVLEKYVDLICTGWAVTLFSAPRPKVWLDHVHR
jgi:hypothetical protein